MGRLAGWQVGRLAPQLFDDGGRRRIVSICIYLVVGAMVWKCKEKPPIRRVAVSITPLISCTPDISHLTSVSEP